jgi:ferredoxin--NADP+ reductase
MARPRSIQVSPYTVSRNREITPGSYLLSVPRDFDFQAGQVVGIKLQADEEARVYSIASGEKDEEVEILFNVKPDGYLSPKLAALRPGDPVFMSQPFGSFLASKEEAWWIASGTGIAPYRSMLRSGYGEGKYLMHGSRYADDSYFREEFEEALGHHYIRCITQGTPAGKGIFEGRVSDYLKTFDFLPLNRLYYLCGRAEMVIDCREELLKKGVGYRNILAEVYF